MKSLILSILLISISIFVYSQELEKIPEINSRLTDKINLFSQQEKQLLENKLTVYEQNNGSQIVVLIIETTGTETIEEYSMRVAEDWKIGRKEHDDGLILIVAQFDRKLRIEVGYGLEPIITDAVAKWIIDDIIVPEFKNSNFVDGINSGVDQLINLSSGEMDFEQVSTSKKQNTIRSRIILILFVIMVLGPGLIATVRKKGLIFAIIFTIINLIINCIFGFYFGDFSIMYPFMFYTIVFAVIAFVTRGKRGNLTVGVISTITSRGGGYSSGDSFGGGFSGGGGSFGGGGASGSW